MEQAPLSQPASLSSPKDCLGLGIAGSEAIVKKKQVSSTVPFLDSQKEGHHYWSTLAVRVWLSYPQSVCVCVFVP
jgi:hypothetical protein